LQHLSRYFKTSLEDYYYFALNRNVAYLLFTFLIGFFTLAALKSHAMFSSFPPTPLSVMILYAWVTALNFGFCLYMTDEWLSRIWKGWGDFENRTVGKVWLIWFAAFLLAFTIQYLIIDQTFELYDPKMRWLYSVYPKERPSHLLAFIYFFPFWLLGVFVLIQIALRKQSGLKNEKSNLDDLLSQRNWIFKQNLVHPQTSAVTSAGPDKVKVPSELLVPAKDGFERINQDRISHINVEDHYCRIFVKEPEGLKEFYVKISLRDLLEQLPREFFLQIHRSHIVNLAYVSSLIKDSRSYQLALNQGAHTLPISRYRVPQVLSILDKFIG
jgi:hypothetical protein